MSARTEYINLSYAASPVLIPAGEFDGPDEPNEAPALHLTGGSDDGVLIEGTPEQWLGFAVALMAEAKRAMREAE